MILRIEYRNNDLEKVPVLKHENGKHGNRKPKRGNHAKTMENQCEKPKVDGFPCFVHFPMVPPLSERGKGGRGKDGETQNMTL